MGAPQTATEMVRAIRARTGWTQLQIAREGGVSQSTVNRWFKGSKATYHRDRLEILYSRIVPGAVDTDIPAAVRERLAKLSGDQRITAWNTFQMILDLMLKTS